jgi:cytochrome b561
MKRTLIFSCILLLSTTVMAQDDLLGQLLKEEKTDSALLPERMIITQRMLWGEKGLLRTTGIAPLGLEQRKREMQTRRLFLKTHQALGFVTLGGMVAQGIVGARLYNGNYKLNEAHEALAAGLNVSYSLTAAMSLFTPPPLIQRDRKISSLKLHKWLSIVHMSGMLATNILAGQIEDKPSLKPIHRAAAFTTFASFAAAVVVIKF